MRSVQVAAGVHPLEEHAMATRLERRLAESLNQIGQ